VDASSSAARQQQVVLIFLDSESRLKTRLDAPARARGRKRGYMGYAYLKNRRIKKVAEGFCRDCENPHAPNRATCVTCAARDSKHVKNKRKKLKEQGICPVCSTHIPAIGKITCDFCISRTISHRRKKFFKYRAIHFNSAFEADVTGQDLAFLWKRQRGLCALTKDKLSVDTAELDHKTPKSRGGKHIIENLRWVTKEVNRVKRNLLDSEFISLCEKVIETTRLNNG
jgi:5-methylcytosine-specific restriction endonuclease McrA